MEIAMIAAIDQQNAIGLDGDQLVYLSGDLKRFKQLTKGHAIVMGRKTFNALPKGALSDRLNIVLTKNPDLSFPGCTVVTSIEAAIEAADGHQKLFIIGGGKVYQSFMHLTQRLYLTHIDHSFEGADTWFPKIYPQIWRVIENDGQFTDYQSGLRSYYETLEKAGS